MFGRLFLLSVVLLVLLALQPTAAAPAISSKSPSTDDTLLSTTAELTPMRPNDDETIPVMLFEDTQTKSNSVHSVESEERERKQEVVAVCVLLPKADVGSIETEIKKRPNPTQSGVEQQRFRRSDRSFTFVASRG